MSGTGNDFMLIDHRQPMIEANSMSEFAALVCRRKFSAGADGLIFIENSEQEDFKWRFFNADGSVAEMCGNGARCAARFAFLQGIAPAEEMRFKTLAGIIEATVAGSDVSVKMTDPVNLRMNQTISVDNAPLKLHSIDTGVPHSVVFVDDIEQMDVRIVGSSIRRHEAFMPAGTNVNFVQKQGDSFKVRTYERGVENETLACGTGSAACAVIAALLGETASPVDIITSGGDRLTILFDLKDLKDCGSTDIVYNVFLKGPAYVIYTGELDAEALL